MNNNNNTRSSTTATATNQQQQNSSTNQQHLLASPQSGLDTLHEAYSAKIEALERQLNEALGQRSGLERALHHAAADSLRAQNDIKLAKKEAEQIRRQLVMTEAELHKKIEELARRPITSQSGLPADEELKMRHSMAVLRAEIALLSDLVNRSPDQQLQALQNKISELTSDSLKSAEASRSREALLAEVHQRLQIAMERVAHAEDKRDAALSRCATLEDDTAGLRRNLEDTTVALKHQTQCAQTFALGLTKQIISHETSARAAVGRDMAIAERELALYGAGLKTRSLLESSERQSALRMHLLRELATDTTSCYAKDRVAGRFFTKWLGFCLKKRSHTLRGTEEQLQEASASRDHFKAIANEEEARSEAQMSQVRAECHEQMAKMKAATAAQIEQNGAITRSINDAVKIQLEAMEGYVALVADEADARYDFALYATFRERQLLVMLANQSMITLRDTLAKEAADREHHLAKQLDNATQDLATLRATMSSAMQDAEQHGGIIETALAEAKRQRDKQDEEYKRELARQRKDFEDRERRLKLDADHLVALKEKEATLQEQKLRSQLTDKEREQLDAAARAKQQLSEREEARSKAFRQLQEQLNREAGRSPTPSRGGDLTTTTTDESVAREKMRRRWLVENIKQVVDSLEECYFDDIGSIMGHAGLEPEALSNLRRSLIRRANHTNRVIAHWQRRETALVYLVKWMAWVGAKPAIRVRQQASSTIKDLTQKLTRVKDIAQEALREKKRFETELARVEREYSQARNDLEQVQADFDGMRRAYATRKAELLQEQQKNRELQNSIANSNYNTNAASSPEKADEETRIVLAQARGQIEQLSHLLKKSRDAEERHAKTIEDLSEKLNQETEAAAELKQTIVALLVQAEEAGADISAGSTRGNNNNNNSSNTNNSNDQAAERLFVLQSRQELVKELTDLWKQLRSLSNNKELENKLKELVEHQLTASEKKKYLS